MTRIARISRYLCHPCHPLFPYEKNRAQLDGFYRQRFGEDCEKLKEITAWLKDHPKRTMLVAFLQADDPYKIK